MSEVKVNKISPRTNCGTVTVGDSGDSVSVSAGVPVTVNNNLTVSGDLKSAALKAVDGGSIISQCGTNITLGASGDTINLAAGATQSGFGRTGTVDWDTTAKTADFTAVSGNGYFVNTTSGAITVTMPATPSAGDIVSLSDYAGTWGTNNVNLSSANYDGITGTPSLSTNSQTVTLIYVDGTKGWITTNNDTDRISGFTPIVATGGTITTCGDYKIHTFTGPGTFEVTDGAGNELSYMIIAGGGGASSAINPGNFDNGGGGGAGGFRENRAADDSYSVSPLNGSTPVTATITSYPITVGGGGSPEGGDPATLPGGSGSPSSALGITSAGGGGAGGTNPSVGLAGGSGGGGVGYFGSGGGGAGNTPPVSPPQGQPGGAGAIGGADAPTRALSGAGGGGGATAAGQDAVTTTGGNGGSGATTSINGSAVARAGGGGGSGSPGALGTGTDGGGNAQTSGGSSGTANTGGGAGGAEVGGGGAGGSGIVIIRYKYQ